MKHRGDSTGRKKFRHIALPDSLLMRVEEYIGEEEGGHGYTSVPEFVKECIRMRLEDLDLKKVELKRIKEELEKE